MRNKLIKATAWIDIAIILLSLYTAVNVPEHYIFACVTYVCACLWMLGYINANYLENAK